MTRFLHDRPMVYSNQGEFEMPEDICRVASQIVESYENIALDAHPDLSESAVDILRTMIACALLHERLGLRGSRS